jgi:hypothetical protein
MLPIYELIRQGVVIRMQVTTSFLIGALCAALAACSGRDAAPKPEQITEPLHEFLTQKKAETCQGTVEVRELQNIQVQAWNEQLKAWPISAEFAVTCVKTSGGSNTWRSSGEAAACYAMKQGSSYSCSLPGIVGELEQRAKEEMKEAMQKALQSMPR